MPLPLPELLPRALLLQQALRLLRALPVLKALLLRKKRRNNQQDSGLFIKPRCSRSGALIFRLTVLLHQPRTREEMFIWQSILWDLSYRSGS
jgi:hypothetical protein